MSFWIYLLRCPPVRTLRSAAVLFLTLYRAPSTLARIVSIAFRIARHIPPIANLLTPARG